MATYSATEEKSVLTNTDREFDRSNGLRSISIGRTVSGQFPEVERSPVNFDRLNGPRSISIGQTVFGQF